MSLELIINNEVLDLTPGTSLTLTYRSPLFDKEKVERVFSYPFKVDATPNNVHILRHANRLDSKSKKKKYPAVLKIQGVQYETGVFIISDWTDKTIEGHFNNLPLELLKTLRNLNLQDLPLSRTIVNTPYTPVIELQFNFLGGGSNLAININGTTYQEPLGSWPDIADAINADWPGFFTIINTGGLVEIDTSVVPNLQITLSPDDATDAEAFFPFQVDYTAEQACIDDWLLFLNGLYNSTSPDVSHRFPVIEAKEFYNGNLEEYSGLLNAHLSDQSYAYNEPGTDTHRFAIAPQPSLKYIIEQVMAFVGMTQISGDFLNDEDIQNLIVFSNRALDRYVSIADFFTDVTYEEIQQAGENAGNPALKTNIWSASYNLAQHLPEMTMYDFLMSLRSTFPILFLFRSTKAVEIRRIDLLLKQSIEDYTSLTEPGYKGQSAQYEGFILDYNRSTDEEVAQAGQLEKVISGDNEDDLAEFISDWYTLYHKKTTNFAFHNPYTIPYWDGNGYSEELGLTAASPMRLLFYHGKQPDSALDNYPYASHHNLNYFDQRISEYSLDWAGDDGLYEKWWKEYIRLIVEGESVQRVMRLSIHQLIELRNNPFKRILINDPMGQSVGWLKEVKFKVDTNKVLFAQIEIVKL